MALETGTHIDDLVITNPVGATDKVAVGDDHLRLIKTCVIGSLPTDFRNFPDNLQVPENLVLRIDSNGRVDPLQSGSSFLKLPGGQFTLFSSSGQSEAITWAAPGLSNLNKYNAKSGVQTFDDLSMFDSANPTRLVIPDKIGQLYFLIFLRPSNVVGSEISIGWKATLRANGTTTVSVGSSYGRTQVPPVVFAPIPLFGDGLTAGDYLELLLELETSHPNDVFPRPAILIRRIF